MWTTGEEVLIALASLRFLHNLASYVLAFLRISKEEDVKLIDLLDDHESSK